MQNNSKPSDSKSFPTGNIEINQEFWNHLWENRITHWDIGYPSPAIAHFMEKVDSKDASILIPGCGNAYEAEYLDKMGFKNITIIDIAPIAVEFLRKKFEGNPSVTIVCGDFFELEGKYDIIIEQTFFCALPPERRKDYVVKMHSLLNERAYLVGLLFDKDFGNPYPPFGGHKDEYVQLFSERFDLKKMENCYNSIPKRQGSELFIQLMKK